MIFFLFRFFLEASIEIINNIQGCFTLESLRAPDVGSRRGADLMNVPKITIKPAELPEASGSWNVRQLFESNAFEFIAVWFTDMTGRWMRLTWPRSALSYDKLARGLHASVVATQWRDSTDCDYLFKIDFDTVFFDPCEPSVTLSFVADVWDADGSKQYSRDPRGVLRRALKLLDRVDKGCTCNIGPELEFYILDEVRYNVSGLETYVNVVEAESPSNTRQTRAPHNRGFVLGHSSYHLSPTSDYSAPTREAILRNLAAAGLSPLHNFHEAGPAQAEIGIQYLTGLRAADAVQLYKRVSRATSTKLGQIATFMPAPVPYAAGSGLHLHLSLWSGKKNLFSGDALAGLSQTALFAIGGLIRYARPLCAFLTPSPNSYCRLAVAFNPMRNVEYGVSNRRLPIRIPPIRDPEDARIEVRFADGSANPYLALAAVVIAMVAGIEEKIDPGEPVSSEDRPGFLTDLRNRSKSGLARDLEEAVLELDLAKEVFLRDGVFSEDMLSAHICELSRRALFRTGRAHPQDYAESLDC
jgi:glutamine synthetase